MSTVGGISEIVPSEVVCPRPAPTWPLGPFGSSAPYMYVARRDIALPAKTFSLTACSRKPSGAMTGMRPDATSSSATTPRAPPKWSTWLCV